MLICDGGYRQNDFPFGKASPDNILVTSRRCSSLDEI